MYYLRLSVNTISIYVVTTICNVKGMTKERIEGALQFKLLLALMEGPSYGADLMKKLNISSSGTIYPALKTMRQKGLIKYMSGTAKEKKKLYVLSTKGKEQLRRILLGVGRRYFSRFIDPYIQPLVEKLEEIVPACQQCRLLLPLYPGFLQGEMLQPDRQCI